MLLAKLLEEKRYKILVTLAKAPKKLFHIHQLSEDSKIPVATTFRITQQFAKDKILETTTIGKTKLYRLNSKHVTELQKILGVRK